MANSKSSVSTESSEIRRMRREAAELARDFELGPIAKTPSVRSVREHHNLSVEALAVTLHVKPETVRRWEAGKSRPTPPLRLMLDLIERHGPDYLS